MDYTFSTVYMAIIASNILLILLTIVFRSKKIMINTGYRLLAIFVIMTLIRFLLPFEMPFTKTIALPEWISFVVTWIRHIWFSIGSVDITVWLFLQIVWILGFVVKLALYIKVQFKDRYYILSHMWDVTHAEPYQSILEEICKERNRKNVFGVAEVAGLKIPLLYGIVKPYILLPKDHHIPEKDLYYIFAHEASHHFHHDLITKFLVRLIDMVYWCNPFCRILTKQTDMILEMRIDDVITDLKEQHIKNYLNCLIDLKERATEPDPVSHIASMPLFSSENDDQSNDLEKRFEMLIASNQKKKQSLNIIMLLLVIGIYLSSYAYIFEAYYANHENLGNSFAPTTDAFYAIQKEDNTYDIYYGEIFLENTSSLEYHEGIKIYTEKEYYHEEH